MSKMLWKILPFAPVLLGVLLVGTDGAIASDASGVSDVQPEAEVEVMSASGLTIEELNSADRELLMTVAEPASLDETSDSFAQPELAQPTAIAQAASAAPSTSSSLTTVTPYSQLERNPLGQVTSVTQLSDVQPTDWAYQALQSLVERYGCIVGYPDGTYRGNRALTRYEFAAGLNACLDRIVEVLDAATNNLASREDLDVIQRLQEEFAGELAILRGRVDALEARTAELEANQFSTTTVLSGEVIFSISDLFGDEADDDFFPDAAREGNNTVLRSRVRLNLATSFTGEDVLSTRLAAGTVVPFETPNTFSGIIPEGTKEGLLIPRIDGTTDGDVVLDRLTYRFPAGDRLNLFVAATGAIHNEYVFSTVNPYFGDFDGGNGSISVFSQESPIYRIGGGAGAALNLSLDEDESFVLSLGYLAEDAADPSAGNGLFNGDYAALGQLTFTPSNTFQLGLTYVHGYHGSSSSFDDNYIFDLGAGDDFFTGTVPANATHVVLQTPAVSNSYGIQASLQISPQFVINAFGGYTDLIFINTGDGEVWYYGLGLAFPDLFQPGNLGGIMVGVEPYLAGENIDGFFIENDTSLHVEAFYRYQLTDNISITPGVVWITAPEQNSEIEDYVVGTLRTTFRF